MLKSIISFLGSIAMSLISAGGYAGIVAAMAIESACIPLPSEIIMPFSGYLVASGRFVSSFGDFWALVYVSIAGAFGCVVGSVAAYAVGIGGGRPILEKYGKYVLIHKKDIELSDRWFAKYGEMSVLISRVLPVIRTFISLPAGIGRVHFGRFILYTFTGSLPWCFALAYVGYVLGKNVTTFVEWEGLLLLKLGKWMHLVDALIIAAISVSIFLYVRRHFREEEKHA
jgi:membrane protein DedA with SNARE-associated domain